MDTDSEGESSEPEQPDSRDRGGAVSEDSEPFTAEQHLGDFTAPFRPKLRAQEYSEQRWKSLQRFYEDGYAELFGSETAEGPNDGAPPINLESGQVGAVMWLSSEKDALYQALSRKGERDLPSLASAISSKSQLEIRDYLLQLREKVSERHLFHRQSNCISHADIPAAVEIGPHVEEALEQAANAQLAYEGYYAHVARSRNIEGTWIINGEIAERLDAEHDEAEIALLENVEATSDSSFQTLIFYVSNLIKLSETFFMNHGTPSKHENWRIVAMKGETPGVTQEVISELYDLIVNLTRKLVQTSIFLAQSRQRATTTKHYIHRAMVKEQDVAAAVNVLSLKCDLWDFWIGLPRRNKLTVLDDKHRKGGRLKRSVMSYEAVEQVLSKRKSRWRGRRRSSSAGTDTSMTEDEAFDIADGKEDDSSEEHGSASDSSVPLSTSSSDEYAHNEPEAHPLDAILDSDSSESLPSDLSSDSPAGDSDSTESAEYGGLNFHPATPRQKRRQIYLEQQQDAHLEQIDAEASKEEEMRLLTVLGREVPETIKDEKMEISEASARPKVLRKLMEELKDPLQSLQYSAEWELYGAPVPNNSFVETERSKKRVRTTTQ